MPGQFFVRSALHFKNRKVLVLLVVILACIGVEYFIFNKYISALKKEKSFTEISRNDPIADSASDIANKNYDDAISTMNNAIAEDPYTTDYYSMKAEAEYLSGDKTAAIATVNEGLKVDPENELLKSKLDVLEKNTFNNNDASGGRE